MAKALAAVMVEPRAETAPRPDALIPAASPLFSPSMAAKWQADVPAKPPPTVVSRVASSPAPSLDPEIAPVPEPGLEAEEGTVPVARLTEVTSNPPSLVSADLQPRPHLPDADPDSLPEPLADPVSQAERPSPITETNLSVQGLYVLQGDRSSGRARVTGTTFITPNLLLGGTLDWVAGPDLTSRDGVKITEVYLAASVPGTPGLRFRLGHLDLTSYFDRNSFAKDLGRDFFNSTFHTNPALIAAANVTASRLAGLVQWSVTDNLMVSASTFASSGDLSDFALDGLVGEVSVRSGNLIVRGTALTGRDTEFQGTGDRLSSYGLNAEWFVPQANLGFFGRYGRLNGGGGFLGDTYSLGLNAFDVFMEEDRLGLAYGRNLPTAAIAGQTPDVLEVFYDVVALPYLRMGVTFQQRNHFQDSFLGFRIRSDVNLLPTRSRP